MWSHGTNANGLRSRRGSFNRDRNTGRYSESRLQRNPLKRHLFLLPILALVFWASAEASDVVIQIQAQSDAPVSVMGCSLTKQAVQIARGVSVEGLNTGVVFKNESVKAIVAVTFRFTMIDGSGAPLETRFKDTVGTFSPAVVIDNIHWLEVNSWPTLREMSCSVGHVSFQDGSAWDAQQ